VTLPEEKMAARVGASLLVLGLGIGECVARNTGDIGDIVVALARHTKRFASLRNKFAEARHTMPLFDTVKGVRNLEVALRLTLEAVEGRFHVISSHARGGREPDVEAKLLSLRVDTEQAEKRSAGQGFAGMQ